MRRTQFQTNEVSPYLALDFRTVDYRTVDDETGQVKLDSDGNPIMTEVCVMQSARYLCTNDIREAITQCHKDADWFATVGFDVIREKIESAIYGVQGLPQTDAEMAQYLSRYHEFHLRVGKKDGDSTEPLQANELAQLKAISKQFSDLFSIPVPLSYNKTKSQENLHQRFLNLRFRNTGTPTVLKQVQAVRDAINAQTTFNVEKVHSEFIVYDSFTELDKHWID